MQITPLLVSVIIPTYNRAATICAAIDSVLAQTYPEIEIIVVDDGSTDDTYQILKAYQQSRKIVYLTQANSGPAAARNRGIKAAHGQYIAFLDADDRWLSEKLAKQIPLFSDADTCLVFSDMQFTGGRTGLYSSLLRRGYRRGDVIRDLLAENFVPTSSVVVRNIALDGSKVFLDDREHVPVGEDYYLWLQLAREFKFNFVNEPLVEYSVHDGQLSGNALRTYQSVNFLFRKLLRDSSFVEYRKQIFLRALTFYFKYVYYSIVKSRQRQLFAE